MQKVVLFEKAEICQILVADVATKTNQPREKILAELKDSRGFVYPTNGDMCVHLRSYEPDKVLQLVVYAAAKLCSKLPEDLAAQFSGTNVIVSHKSGETDLVPLPAP